MTKQQIIERKVKLIAEYIATENYKKQRQLMYKYIERFLLLGKEEFMADLVIYS